MRVSVKEIIAIPGFFDSGKKNLFLGGRGYGSGDGLVTMAECSASDGR
jgi:hypothetical protein